MINKIKIITLVTLIAIVVFGAMVYAETTTGTLEYYKSDGTTLISSQEVTSGSTITIADDAEASEGRWIVDDKGLTFAVGQKLSWNGLFPLKLRAYRDDLIYEIPEEIPDETSDPPSYIPEGYTPVEGTNMDDGYTIQDSSGNQYVWVEVPQTEEVYSTAGLAITEFTDAEYISIEEDLHTYTSVYRNGTSYTDTYYSDETTGLTSTQYTELKQKMLKSVYQNGGFYVGKYEAGTETARTSSEDALTTPVIKQNVYPYNYVTTAQAQTLANGMASGEYTSSLMFGVQWDLILKYLETKGATQAELNSDSTSWGNYADNLWTITNTNSKYYDATADSSSWVSGAYGKKYEERKIILSPGADISFCKEGIYDLAGNLFESTLENRNESNGPCIYRGGGYNIGGGSYPVNIRAYSEIGGIGKNGGFRVALYHTPEEEATPYIPSGFSHVAGTDLDTGYTIQDGSGNQYVWVEVPQTTTVYPTAGLSITEFTDAEYTKIENDLHTYTATYRESSYTDTYYSDETTGLTETEYYALKNKMLKSVYQNGGFYVGKYEAGTETARTSESDTLATPVIKQNMYPYGFVTTAQAQSLADGMASGEYTSSLMFGVQWDLIMKYLETKGATQAELISDSTSWGNYYNNLWTITNTNSKYSPPGSGWVSGAYGKKVEEMGILLSTGANDAFSKQGIYDLGGNVNEKTLEYSSISIMPITARGGNCNSSSGSAGGRESWFATISEDSTLGFRIVLY